MNSRMASNFWPDRTINYVQLSALERLKIPSGWRQALENRKKCEKKSLQAKIRGKSGIFFHCFHMPQNNHFYS